MRAMVRRRKWWAVLAIVALGFLSLRPACELWLGHAAEHHAALHASAHDAVGSGASGHAQHAPQPPHDAACCASIASATLVKPADAATLRTAQKASSAVLAFTQTALRIAAPMLHALTDSVIPPGNPPFYARSSRILR